MTTLTPKDGLALAVKAMGSKYKLVTSLGLTPGAASFWKREIPLRRVVEVSRLTGIPPHLLRPDYYPAPAPTVTASVAMATVESNPSERLSHPGDVNNCGIKGSA